MKHVSIPLSDAQHAMLEARVSRGEYDSVEAYVSALIDAEARSQDQERLEELLMAGMASQTSPWTRSDADRLGLLAREGR